MSCVLRVQIMFFVLWVLVMVGVFVVVVEVWIFLRMIVMVFVFFWGRMFFLIKIMFVINLGIEEVERRGVLFNYWINLMVVDIEESVIVGFVCFFNVIYQQGGKINLFLGFVEDYIFLFVGGYVFYWNVLILIFGGFFYDFKEKR